MDSYYNERTGKYHVGRKKFNSFLEAKHEIEHPTGTWWEDVPDTAAFVFCFFFLLFGVPMLHLALTGEYLQF